MVIKVKYSPQVSSNKIHYTFVGEKIIAKIDSVVDTFDFSEFPDGELMIVDNETGEDLIVTSLPINPIVSAKRVQGVLHVKLLNWVNADENDDTTLFPDWIEV